MTGAPLTKSPFYTADHIAFRDVVRRFVEKEIEPYAHEWDESGTFPRELYEKAAAIGLLGASVRSADAYQGNMERALGSLNEALASLRESTANKGGHRNRAMELVRQAIEETQAGVEFADDHGGGGR